MSTQLESALALLECLKEHGIHNRRQLDHLMKTVDADPTPPEPPKPQLQQEEAPLQSGHTRIIDLSAPMVQIQRELDDLIRRLWKTRLFVPEGNFGHCRAELEDRAGVRYYDRESTSEDYREDACILIKQALEELEALGVATDNYEVKG